ncbi:hypothetical protein XENORESO_001158 [Xenotaenia resolanae]|uniref:Secreted protein n=1 Tax=Xenotaenia resolanae TaxID=208358 RepID=A0ABV0WQM3_9TELE
MITQFLPVKSICVLMLVSFIANRLGNLKTRKCNTEKYSTLGFSYTSSHGVVPLCRCPVTWESGGRGRRRHGDGNPYTAAATVLPAAAATAAAGVTASTATTTHTHTHAHTHTRAHTHAG